jgi:hypothetical protein
VELPSPSGGHARGREGLRGTLGTTKSPPVGATTRDEQWTVCRDMIRSGSNGLPAHFTRATISTCRLPQRGADQPLAPIEHGRFGALPSGHLGGAGLDLVLAALAPDDQPDAGGGSAAERHR